MTHTTQVLLILHIAPYKFRRRYAFKNPTERNRNEEKRTETEGDTAEMVPEVPFGHAVQPVPAVLLCTYWLPGHIPWISPVS